MFTKTRPELILGTIAGYFTDLLIFRTALAKETEKDIKIKLGCRLSDKKFAYASRAVDVIL